MWIDRLRSALFGTNSISSKASDGATQVVGEASGLVRGSPVCRVVNEPTEKQERVYLYDRSRLNEDQRIASDHTLRSKYMVPLVMMLSASPGLTNRECRERLGKKVRSTYMKEARKLIREASLQERLNIVERVASPDQRKELQINLIAQEMLSLGIQSIALVPSATAPGFRVEACLTP